MRQSHKQALATKTKEIYKYEDDEDKMVERTIIVIILENG